MNALPIVFKPALVALALATATAFAQQPAPAAPAPALSFMTVRVSDGPRSVALDAVVEAVRQTTLSAQVSGAIVALSVKAGDTVRAGQPLLRIDAQSAQQGVAASVAQVEAAQAQLNIAVRELDRQKQLFAQQYISQAALERAESQFNAAHRAGSRAAGTDRRASQAQSGLLHRESRLMPAWLSEVPVTQGDMVAARPPAAGAA
jgi:multidrug efflux system membrane fusion protein